MTLLPRFINKTRGGQVPTLWGPGAEPRSCSMMARKPKLLPKLTSSSLDVSWLPRLSPSLPPSFLIITGPDREERAWGVPLPLLHCRGSRAGRGPGPRTVVPPPGRGLPHKEGSPQVPGQGPSFGLTLVTFPLASVSSIVGALIQVLHPPAPGLARVGPEDTWDTREWGCSSCSTQLCREGTASNTCGAKERGCSSSVLRPQPPSLSRQRARGQASASMGRL